MTNRYYPVALNMRERPVLIVGGGRVAERKTLTLYDTGAAIGVISPALTVKLKHLAKAGKISWFKRKVRKNDLRKTEIVIAATSDSGVNKNLSRWAREQGVWINVVDHPNLSDFISTAVFRKNKALVSVYTDAKDPVFSRDLKNFLKEHWSEFLSYRDRLQKS